MDEGLVRRAVAAAASVAREFGLRVDDVRIVQNSNTLALRLMPCDLFARVARAGQSVAAFEVALGQQLAAARAPIARLDPRVAPQVYERDGFEVTYWTYYESAPDAVSPADYADALHELHTAMRSVTIDAPDVTDRVADAETLLTDRARTPELPEPDRALLLDVVRDGREMLRSRGGESQLLHGEPHPGNLLATRDGLLFIDLETCCRGAMVATWRWDEHDEFPDGRRHAGGIVDLLRDGPPWPALGALNGS